MGRFPTNGILERSKKRGGTIQLSLTCYSMDKTLVLHLLLR